MVRGLIIRKTFIVVDLALLALVAAVVGLVAMELTRVITGPDARMQELGTTSEASVQPLPQVAERAAYAPLKLSGLFGEAGKWDPKSAPPPPPPPPPKPPDPDVKPTTLNLHLVGTVALGEHSKFSTAFIENLDANDRGKSYSIGDQIMDNVTLDSVLAREVKVLNKRFDPAKLELLKMDEADPEPAPAAKAPATPAAPPNDANASDRVSLKRDEIVQELYKNYADLVNNLKPVMAKDENGNVIGVTAPNIGQVPMAQKLGFKDNDILQTVNNEQIDSEQKILEMVTKYQSTNSFRIGIMRDGKPKIITYHLD